MRFFIFLVLFPFVYFAYAEAVNDKLDSIESKPHNKNISNTQNTESAKQNNYNINLISKNQSNQNSPDFKDMIASNTKESAKIESSVITKETTESKTQEIEYKKGRKFGLSFIIGLSGGWGGGNANIAPFTYQVTQNNQTMNTTITAAPKNKDDGLEMDATMIVRSGLLFRFDSGLCLQLSLLYSQHEGKIDGGYLTCTYNNASCYTNDIRNITLSHKQVGVDFRAGWAVPEFIRGIVYVGGGALFDVGSTMRVVGWNGFTQDIKNAYPFWELGYTINLARFMYIEMSYRHILDISNDKTWATLGSFNLGFGFEI
ncbi:hypothetical protein DCO58_12055 [Helicobacter saguini]|uniref:Outer membrane beta-barrel protein n=1 Tax=Helicobacter saguini TaxID=1548018 RepID=A0A347VQE3_9HELI|nr:hypothetical protein [Helicobacter saguini]MWV60977.1 hypothetical protein [Helicobacter saguini]MWV68354.1 hypothetical protein [Helicobacter saguini]MWV70181.1 hypothetical protein [Helicobacter saguini]MWV72084.1 hypothetical protein [Helicobacter saguini]TLD93696.1 hypothetical protein LS64_007835 [Helicobacter saguini]